jgi:hypothetical protein
MVKKIFSPENYAVNELMWKDIVAPVGPQMKIWRKRIACLMSRATNTHLDLCNFFGSSVRTMVARTRLSVTLNHIACLVITEMMSVYCAARP